MANIVSSFSDVLKELVFSIDGGANGSLVTPKVIEDSTYMKGTRFAYSKTLPSSGNRYSVNHESLGWDPVELHASNGLLSKVVGMDGSYGPGFNNLTFQDGVLETFNNVTGGGGPAGWARLSYASGNYLFYAREDAYYAPWGYNTKQIFMGCYAEGFIDLKVEGGLITGIAFSNNVFSSYPPTSADYLQYITTTPTSGQVLAASGDTGIKFADGVFSANGLTGTFETSNRAFICDITTPDVSNQYFTVEAFDLQFVFSNGIITDISIINHAFSHYGYNGTYVSTPLPPSGGPPLP